MWRCRPASGWLLESLEEPHSHKLVKEIPSAQAISLEGASARAHV